MTLYPQTPNLSPSLFRPLRDLIHERTGIFYAQEQAELLASRLAVRLSDLGFGSFLDYYYLLKEDTGDTEWKQLVDTITIRETFFWREIEHVRTLSDVVLPHLLGLRPAEPLRIWSAACATGEEPLTIAMVLHETGWLGRVPIELYASDISPAAISKARRGIYAERSLRNLPDALRARYFTAVPGQGWQIAPELHSTIRWTVTNLMNHNDVALLATSSVIFCRNVFLYFSERAIRKTVQFFFERMMTPGYLFVGVTEPLLRLATEFHLHEVAGTFVYVKQ